MKLVKFAVNNEPNITPGTLFRHIWTDYNKDTQCYEIILEDVGTMKIDVKVERPIVIK